MPTPLTPWRVAINHALADGEWHNLDEVRAAGARAVPASRAVTHRRKARDKQLRGGGRVSGYQIAVEDEVRIGASDVARSTITSAIHVGTIERDGDLIRLRPKQ